MSYKRKYTLTEKARAAMAGHAEKWIAIARSTDPIDRERCRAEMRVLYRSAKLEPPAREVFAPSPMVGAYASTIASGVWWLREHQARHIDIFGRQLSAREIDAARDLAVALVCGSRSPVAASAPVVDAATRDATSDATEAATDGATRAATEAATRDATDDATWAATWAATAAATEDATWDATEADTRAATEAATRDATWAATEAVTRDATRGIMDGATRAATEGATRAATDGATRASTWDATRDATDDATWDATRDATEAATWAATRAATSDATRASAWDATRAATERATWAATSDATWDTTERATRDATRAATWDATRDTTERATRDATERATWDATSGATWAATDGATWAATDDATRAATERATWDATEDATWAATDGATRDATEAATEAATRSATDPAVARAAKWMASLVTRWSNLYHGGNQWAGYVAWLSFFRHHAPEMELPEWDAFAAYEALAEYGGARYVHTRFWIMCERPTVLRYDERGRPHCADGPSHRWQCGTEAYYWHGTRVQRELVLSPETTITAEWLAKETNSEVIRAAAERLGWSRFIERADMVTLDEWKDPSTGLDYALLDWRTRPGEDAPRFLRMRSPTVKDGTQPVYVEPVHPKLKTAQAARRWQFPRNLSPLAVRHGDVIADAGDGNFEWPTPEWANKNPRLVFDQEA